MCETQSSLFKKTDQSESRDLKFGLIFTHRSRLAFKLKLSPIQKPIEDTVSASYFNSYFVLLTKWNCMIRIVQKRHIRDKTNFLSVEIEITQTFWWKNRVAAYFLLLCMYTEIHNMYICMYYVAVNWCF